MRWSKLVFLLIVFVFAAGFVFAQVQENCANFVDDDGDGDIDCADSDCTGETCTYDCPDRCDIDGDMNTWDWAPLVQGTCTAEGICDATCVYQSVCSDNTDPYYDGAPSTSDAGRCEAQCDADDDCGTESCSETYVDYCDGAYLVDYGVQGDMGSETVSDTCSNTCDMGSCECTDCTPDCSITEPDPVCSALCGAELPNEVTCGDGVDNDCDGDVDCADEDCLGEPGPGGNLCCTEDSDCPADTCSDTGTNYGGGSCSATDNFCDQGQCDSTTTGGSDVCTGDDDLTVDYYVCEENDGNADGDDTCTQMLTERGDLCTKAGTSCTAYNWECNINLLQSSQTSGTDSCSGDQIDPYYVCSNTDAGTTEDTCVLETYDCNDEDGIHFDDYGCGISTGNIYSFFDDYTCGGGVCVDSGDNVQGSVYEECTDSCSDTDAAQSDPFKIQGTCTEEDPCSSESETNCPQTVHQDSCSDNILTEWSCDGNDCVSSTKDCNDYDCSTPDPLVCQFDGDSVIQEVGDDYDCGTGRCEIVGGTICSGPWTCSENNECNAQLCAGDSYMCYMSGTGFVWGTAPGAESVCNDGYDNDCDTHVDCDDSDCTDGLEPETTIHYSEPFVGNTAYYVSSSTEISFTADDETDIAGCEAGVDSIYYRYTTVQDSHCQNHECDAEAVGDFQEYTSPFSITGESCNLIEYYSVDNEGNVEDIKKECFYVDTTAPSGTKDVGTPNYPDDSDWFVRKDITDVTLDCQETGPYPVGGEEVCYKVTYESADVTADYCSVSLDNGWCCVTGPEVINFDEECTHELEYFCRDALGNTNNHDAEYFFVDATSPEITSVSNYPEKPAPGNTVTVTVEAADAKSGISCDPTGVELHYRINGGNWNHVDMPCTASFSAEMGTFNEGDLVEYYITAEDRLGITATDNNQGTYYRFYVGFAYDISLYEDWNLIGFPVNPDNPDVESVFSEVDLDVVWTYDDDGWTSYRPDAAPETNSLSEIKAGNAYWVNMDAPGSLIGTGNLLLAGNNNPPERTLQPGWMLLGYYGAEMYDSEDNFQSTPVACALYSLMNNDATQPYWTKILTFNNELKEFETVSMSDDMNPFAGYWTFMSNDRASYVYGLGLYGDECYDYYGDWVPTRPE